MPKKAASSTSVAKKAAAKKSAAGSDKGVSAKKSKRRPASYASYIKKIAKKREMSNGKKPSITDDALSQVTQIIEYVLEGIGENATDLAQTKDIKTVGPKQIQLAVSQLFLKASRVAPQGQASFSRRAIEYMNQRVEQYDAAKKLDAAK